MKRYLVTGAQGFTGRFLVADILASDPDAIVVGIGRSAPSARFTHEITLGDRRVPAPLADGIGPVDPSRFRYLACDLADQCAVRDLLDETLPDVIMHTAAALRDDPADQLVDSNIAATIVLFQSLSRYPAKPRVVYASSGATYGPCDVVPVLETQRCAPVDPYAMSKLAGEYTARVLAGEHGIPVVFARIFNIAGPGQDERHVCARFVSQLIAIRDLGAPPRLRVGDLRPTRDFIDVRDVARALTTLSAAGAAGQTYNVASGRETAIEDVLRLSLALTKLEGTVEIVSDYVRSNDVSRQYADIGKLAALGFAPRWSLQATLGDLITYYTEAATAASA